MADGNNVFTLGLDVSATKTLIMSQLQGIINEISNSGNLKVKVDLDTVKLQQQLKSELSGLKESKIKLSFDAGRISQESKRLFQQINDGASNSAAGMNKLGASFKGIGSVAKSGNTQITGFFSNLKSGIETALTNMMNYRLAYEVINRTTDAIRDMINEVADLDRVLTDFNKVAKLSDTGLIAFTEKAYKEAEQVGRTGKGLIEAAAEFRRAGYDLNESLDLGSAALMTTNISDKITDTSDAASKLIAVLKGFNIGSSDVTSVLDQINEVANNSPIGFAEIADGLQRVSGTMNQTGTSLSETIGLLTGGFAQLRNISKVSTGLITISSRLRGVGEDGETEEGLRAKLQEDFGKIGVDIEDSAGGLRSIYDIIKDYAMVYDELTDKQRQYYGELAAGKRQISVWNAMVQQINDVDTAISQAENSMGSATASNEIYKQSVAGLKQEFQNAFQELSQATIDSDWIKDLISAGTDFLGTLTNIVSESGLLHDSISIITGAIKGLSSVLNSITDNKALSTLISSFITMKTIAAGMSLFTGGKYKNGLGEKYTYKYSGDKNAHLALTA